MRVAAQITEGLFGSAKRPFAVDNPLLAKCLPQQLCEDLGASEWFQRTMEAEFVVGEGSLQRFGELATKDFAQHGNRKEELFL